MHGSPFASLNIQWLRFSNKKHTHGRTHAHTYTGIGRFCFIFLLKRFQPISVRYFEIGAFNFKFRVIHWHRIRQTTDTHTHTHTIPTKWSC